MKTQAQLILFPFLLLLSMVLLGCGAASTPAPTIVSLFPSSVTVGDPAFTLSVLGQNFTSTTQVSFDGILLTPTTWSPTALWVDVPITAFSTAKTAQVHVTGSTSNSVAFTVYNPIPVVTSLSLTTVHTGDPDFTLEIVGSHFVSDTTVDFGGTTLTPTSIDLTGDFCTRRNEREFTWEEQRSCPPSGISRSRS